MAEKLNDELNQMSSQLKELIAKLNAQSDQADDQNPVSLSFD